MGAALLAVGIELLIGIGIGLIVTVIGLFFGNIIVFDSIALAILAGFLSHGLLGVHPALAIVIGIAVLLGLLLLHCTRPGFWLMLLPISPWSRAARRPRPEPPWSCSAACRLSSGPDRRWSSSPI